MELTEKVIIWSMCMERHNNDLLPSLSDSTNAITIYAKLKSVETPNQTPRAERCGIQMANIAHTTPATMIQYGSGIFPSSLNRT